MPKISIFCQNGEILPNLITLLGRRNSSSQKGCLINFTSDPFWSHFEVTKMFFTEMPFFGWPPKVSWRVERVLRSKDVRRPGRRVEVLEPRAFRCRWAGRVCPSLLGSSLSTQPERMARISGFIAVLWL